MVNDPRANWDAARYERQPLPHERWGDAVIRRAALSQGENLVDAGSGTGRDAEAAMAILDRLSAESGVQPGWVVLLDANASMVARAVERFSARPKGFRPYVAQVNLTDPWPVPDEADVVISVAALHWIHDHNSVFARAAAATRHGGRLHVDCGGAGNIDQVIRAAQRARLAIPRWRFAAVDETVRALRATEWTPHEVWLEPDPLVLQDQDTFREFAHSVMFHEASEPQLDALMAACPEPVVDYVRLNIDASRA